MVDETKGVMSRMEELELRQYWNIIKRRWIMVIAIPVIAVLVSGLYAFKIAKPQYEASTTLLVNFKQTQINQLMTALQTSQMLTKTYQVVIKSQAIEQKVISDLHLDMTVPQLDKLVSVSSPDQSQELQVTVMAASESQAVAIANDFAKVFSSRAEAMVSAKNVTVLDPAVSPADPKPAKPNKKLDLAIALILGLMVSIGLAFLLEYLDTRFRDEEDVERTLQLPVLGTIMDYTETDLR